MPPELRTRFLVPLLLVSSACAGLAQDRATILTDAFGKNSKLAPDWGYSALIEFGGKRILFDTGDNAALFPENMQRMHIDLSHLDMVVISHSHADHTAGLRYVLSLNPKTPLFVPDDPYFTGTEVPRRFFTTDAQPALPAAMRYFGGNVPEHVPGWQLYNDTNMSVVSEAITVAPGVRLVALVSDKPAFRGLHEISLIIDTPKGPVIFAGCSHPGIEQIMAAATASSPQTPVYMLFGGLHLVQDTREQIEATLNVLANQYYLQKIAVGHCTGELAFLMIKQKWGNKDIYAGLGESIAF